MGHSEEDYSSLEENTFTRKMNDANAYEQNLIKKLEASFQENEEISLLLKQSDQQLVQKTIENQNIKN